MVEESRTQTIPAMDQPWSEDEFSLALTKLRNGKAPGPDFIHAEFLRYGGPQLHCALRILFNEILQWEVWPVRWCLGLICPIYKRAGDEAELDNYRPITLLSIVSKLFEILLNTRLMAWAETNRILCDEQGGFRTKRGCADQLFILKEVWSSRREQKQPTYAAFLDVKSAYDRVWRTGLWYQLFQCGVRGKAWRMIRAMYNGMERVALVDGRRTSPFPVDVGVSQGSVLSPFLYSVFIDGLIRQLKADDSLGVRMAAEQLVGLLYADDIVLLAPDPVTLQRMLDVTSEYARQWRFHFNGRKSQIVVQGTKQQVADAQVHPWRLDGHQLSAVPEYKYLGMETGLPPKAAPHNSFCKRLIHSTTHRAHDILLAGCELNELDARCSSRLWSTLCRPILEYGSEVWSPNQGQSAEMEQVQGWFARRVLGCHQGTPAVFATSELGLRSLQHRREQYHLRYWYRLCAAVPERLLHRVFRQRVRDVKQSPHLTRSSLCCMMQSTLIKYDMEEEWDQVGANQLHEPDEWAARVNKAVRDEETTARQIILSQRSSLDTYAAALIPELGQVASYLLNSRNREGAWIQCRLRSATLPLMHVLARQCHPPRADVHAACPLCPSAADAATSDVDDDAPRVPPHSGHPIAAVAAVESVTHFLSDCPSGEMIPLRRELCHRLRQSILQWQTDQRTIWAAEWKGPALLAPGVNDAILLNRSRAAESANGVQAIQATLTAMEKQLELSSKPSAAATRATSVDWCELLLGRCTDPVTGVRWNASLLLALQSHMQNFLLLTWRARAALLGGVPTLLTGGRGITMVPYQRMKTIGGRRRVRVDGRSTGGGSGGG